MKMSFKKEIDRAFKLRNAEVYRSTMERINNFFEEYVAKLPGLQSEFITSIAVGTITDKNFNDHLTGLSDCIVINRGINPTKEDFYALPGFHKLHDFMRSPETSMGVSVVFHLGNLSIYVNPNSAYETSTLKIFEKSGQDANIYYADTDLVPSFKKIPAPQATAREKTELRYIKSSKGKRIWRAPI